jgi:hypothetical protein
MSINYVIATYNGFTKRTHKHPSPDCVLRCHLEKILSCKNNLSQITIMKTESPNYYKNYYNIQDIIDKTSIPIQIIECKNYGYLGGSWLKAYEIFKNDFDYYLFMADDYCPGMNNFDELLLNSYKQKFLDNIGLLCSVVKGNSTYTLQNRHLPIHWEGCVFCNKETLNKLYSNENFQGDPIKYLDLIDNNIDNCYDWAKLRSDSTEAYYQVSFSHLFTLSKIRHADYLNETYKGHPSKFLYWSDTEEIGRQLMLIDKGDVNNFKYTLDDIYNSPIIPIQLSKISFIQYYTDILFPIEFYPHRQTLDIVQHFEDIIHNKIVCDVGCGAGDILEYIRLNKLCKEVHGIEIDPSRFHKRTNIKLGNVFTDGLPEADVYILWLGGNFPYEELFKKFTGDKIIIYMDSTEHNCQIFKSYKNITHVKKIDFNYDEDKFIHPDKIDNYMQMLKSLHGSKNNYTKCGTRFFNIYKYSFETPF